MDSQPVDMDWYVPQEGYIKYKHLKFVMLELRTDPPFPLGTSDHAADFKARCDLVRELVDKAHAAMGNDATDASILKVVLAPEFLFRYRTGFDATPVTMYRVHNSAGLYSWDEFLQGYEYLRGLFSAEAYRDWLFFAGTVLSKEPNFVTGIPVYYNTALVFVGNNGPYYTYEKQDISHIDRLTHASKAWNAARYDVNVWSYMYQHSHPVMELRGVRFGIEVCLDHGQSCLTAYIANTGQGDVDVHVIVACGMSIVDANVAAKRDGYVARCDGQESSNMCELKYVSGVHGGVRSTAPIASKGGLYGALQTLPLRMVNHHQAQARVFWKVPVPP